MNWQELVDLLQALVPPGTVTTFAQVSQWGYQVPDRNWPVRALLVGARNHGFQHLTNRVVGVHGELADLPDGPEQQHHQLIDEGIPFTPDGRVDFAQIIPVVLV